MHHGIIFNVTQNPFLSRPLGGHRIAHYLRELGWDVEVVDWSNWWSLENLKEFTRSRCSDKTVFIGFGHLFSMWPPMMEEFCSWLKQNYPSIKLISGSAVNPMFNSQQLDYYIQGFGEFALVELLKYICGNGPAPKFNLITGRKVISAIHSYPAFPMKSLMVKYEDRDFIEPHEWLTVEMSRGCMFSCAFCNFPVLGVKDDHSRDADDFEMQLRDTYDRFGVNSYIVADETFNDRTDKITKFADAVQNLNFETWFSGYIRADLLISRSFDREELLRMNYLGHYYGVESFNNKSAKSIGKGMDSEKMKDGLLDVKKYFTTHGSGRYRGHISHIAGLPYETRETLQKAVDWLIKNWQGQSFSMHPLTIPLSNDVNHESKISKDLAKYGYEEISKEELETRYANRKTRLITNFSNTIAPEMRRMFIDEVPWKNPNMDWLDAIEISKNILNSKPNYDFRPSCHGLSYRLTKSKHVNEKLELKYDEFDSQFDRSIEKYIEKKLNFGKK